MTSASILSISGCSTFKRRKDELELYKLFANDPAFKAAWQQANEEVAA